MVGFDKTATEIRIPIKQDTDVVIACQKGRTLATELGFSNQDQVVVVIAISEIARNIFDHAREGEIVLGSAQQNGRCGIVVIARDEGPGISDIKRALQDGYSTGKGLGLGLSGAKRLMDEFEIVSNAGKGTMIVMKKWSSEYE